MNNRIYYFGCIRESGHYLWDREDIYSIEDGILKDGTIPWGYKVDAGLAPQHSYTNGLCTIHEKDGWTALSWWDNSVDTRPNSNSTLLIEGIGYSFEYLVGVLKISFPGVYSRQLKPLTLYKDNRASDGLPCLAAKPMEG